MAKQALGKGLGQLMGSQLAAGKARVSGQPAASGTGKVTAVDFGRGLNTLVHARAEKETPVTRMLLPAWFFFAADLLLLAFTTAICFDMGETPEGWQIAFAFVSTGLGAMLGIAGVLRTGQGAEPAKLN